MTFWKNLRAEHDRRAGGQNIQDLENAWHQLLRGLASKKLIKGQRPETVRFLLARAGEAPDIQLMSRAGEKEPLCTFTLGDKDVSLRLLARQTAEGLSMYTVHADFTERGRKTGIAVHFTREPGGVGACSHALVHAHVDIDDHVHHAIRPPLPALTGGEALQWILAAVDPDQFEPARW